MRPLALGPSLVLCLALPFSLACRPSSSSSTTTGTTYRVAGSLTESGCSPGLDPLDPITFDAEVRSTGSVVYWRLGTGAWIPGSISPDGTFRISTRVAVEAIPPYRGTDPDFDPPRAGCTLLQTETIAGTFSTPAVSDGGYADGGTDAAVASSDAATNADAGVRDAGPPDPTAVGALTATNTIELSIQPGSECAALLATNGGAFPTFPCSAAYSLRGTVRD
jgi:hypothetical protein